MTFEQHEYIVLYMQIQIKPRKHSSKIQMTVYETVDELDTDEVIITDCAMLLYDRPGVKRSSYNIWIWDNLRDAEEFVTYFTLKHSK